MLSAIQGEKRERERERAVREKAGGGRGSEHKPSYVPRGQAFRCSNPDLLFMAVWLIGSPVPASYRAQPPRLAVH